MTTKRQNWPRRKNAVLPLYALATLTLMLVLGSQRAVEAQQWTTNGNNINNTNTDNVGVGTTNPQSTLHDTTTFTSISRRIINDQTTSYNNFAILVISKYRTGGATMNVQDDT